MYLHLFVNQCLFICENVCMHVFNRVCVCVCVCVSTGVWPLVSLLMASKSFWNKCQSHRWCNFTSSLPHRPADGATDPLVPRLSLSINTFPNVFPAVCLYVWSSQQPSLMLISKNLHCLWIGSDITAPHTAGQKQRHVAAYTEAPKTIWTL